MEIFLSEKLQIKNYSWMKRFLIYYMIYYLLKIQWLKLEKNIIYLVLLYSIFKLGREEKN